ncbi:hypothetical protein C8R45DRAFT_338350 [Mycena sanguinolenta]|nr:hypothetical protein C8R45DRAFT_338350 [Mycena sanguinolenta]
MSSPNNSTVSLASTTTVSSRTPLNGSKTVQPKDFQASFASLQSTYGFGGSAPSPIPKKNLAVPSPGPAAPAPAQEPKKNFQTAFAGLQSTYGFGGGGAPSPVPKSKKK